MQNGIGVSIGLREQDLRCKSQWGGLTHKHSSREVDQVMKYLVHCT